MSRSFRCLAVLAALSAAGLPVLAQGLPSAADSTCAQIAGIVQSRGEAVIRTGPNLYDRYVAVPTYCDQKRIGLPTYVRTRDNPACLIGYECRNLGGGQ